mgnify:CR=1 FL=1
MGRVGAFDVLRWTLLKQKFYKYLLKNNKTWIENPRVGGSIPPPGTILTIKINNITQRQTLYACLNQKHTKHTLFAVFWDWVVSGIAVVNTVKLLDAVLGGEQGALCRPPCSEHCVVSMWFKHCVWDTVLAEFCGKTQSVTQRSVMLWEQKSHSTAGTNFSFGCKVALPKNVKVVRVNGHINPEQQNHHFRSGEELEATLHRYVLLYNQQLTQSALGSRSPLQAMKDWHKLKPELFKKRSHYLPRCDM